MKFLARISACVVVAAVACVALAQNPELAPKHTIKEVMAKAHKPPANLLRKVAQGKANDAEKTELLALYKSLAENTPPKGEQESWTERTGLLVAAAQAAVDGDAEAGNLLTKASNCTACHDSHK
jgi:hypothetical protein